VQKDIEELNEQLVIYEKALKDPFFGGSSPAMLDYMIWPIFHRFPMIKEHGFLFNDNGEFPKLAAWVEAMKADRAVQQTDIPLPELKRFYDGYFQGVSNYDFE
jgi:glutathione S-transferase